MPGGGERGGRRFRGGRRAPAPDAGGAAERRGAAAGAAVPRRRGPRCGRGQGGAPRAWPHLDQEVDVRRAGAGADGNQAPAVHALADEEVAHHVGPLLCLGLRGTPSACTSIRTFAISGWPFMIERDQVDELGRAVLDLQLAAAADEADALVELDALCGEARDLGARIGAAVVVLVAVQRLRLRRALVRPRRGCRPCRCPDRGSRLRPRSRRDPRRRSGSCRSCRGCRRRRCPDPGSRRRPGSRRCLRARRGTCRSRRACRRRRCPRSSTGSRRSASCPCGLRPRSGRRR